MDAFERSWGLLELSKRLERPLYMGLLVPSKVQLGERSFGTGLMGT